MDIISWLLVGLVAGGLAGLVTGSGGYGCLGTITIGILGALIGGWLFRVGTGEAATLTGFNLGSVFVAFVGAVALLLVLRAVGGGRQRRR